MASELCQLFTSSNIYDVLRFYDSFNSNEELIDWMRNFPSAEPARLTVIPGDTSIVVVIPTKNANSDLSKNCKKIYEGLTIIFVESGENSRYFHLEYNVNIGIKKAMEYSPKWIIYSNDDVFKIDSPATLKIKLNNIDDKYIDTVFTAQASYHSFPTRFSRPRFTRPFLMPFKNTYGDLGRIDGVLEQLRIEKKFNCRFLISHQNSVARVLYKQGFEFINGLDFGIYSSRYIKSRGGNLFDESLINAHEDHDLAIDLYYNKGRHTKIDYKLGDYIGMSLGSSAVRSLRNLAGLVYLNSKWADKIEALGY